MGIAHTLCSLISNVVIVSASESMFGYLMAPAQIVSQNNQNNNKDNFQSKMAALVGVLENGQPGSPVIENVDSFSRVLQTQNIQAPQLLTIYPLVTAYQLPQAQPFRSSSVYSSSLSSSALSSYPSFQILQSLL